jgi:UDP-3-O-[3-hydroxymyristoyl] glucosamine N-acyltransferase
VGVRDHVHIGSRAVLGAMAGVTNDVPEGARMIGIPATPEREQKIKQAAWSKLPEMRKQLKMLQRIVERLAAQAGISDGLLFSGDASDLDSDAPQENRDAA